MSDSPIFDMSVHVLTQTDRREFYMNCITSAFPQVDITDTQPSTLANEPSSWDAPFAGRRPGFMKVTMAPQDLLPTHATATRGPTSLL